MYLNPYFVKQNKTKKLSIVGIKIIILIKTKTFTLFFLYKITNELYHIEK